MGENILYVAVLLLSLYGCVELIRLIALRLLQTDTGVSSVLVFPISGSCKNMEYIVRAAVSRSRWKPDFKCRILLLDTGMDEHTRKLAEKICRDFENVHISTPKECEKLLTSL